MKRYCLRGHDTEVEGRSSSGNCKTCVKAFNLKNGHKYRKKYSDFTPDEVERRQVNLRDARLKKTYNLTSEEFNLLMIEQESKCAICGSTSTNVKKAKHLFVDHSHATGKVRGLLCIKCNTKLGVLDDSSFMVPATKYLTFGTRTRVSEAP